MKAKESVIRELKRSTREFVAYMNEYAGRQPKNPGNGDNWNSSQIIEHVIRVDQGISHMVHKPSHEMKSGHFTKYQIRDILLNRHDKLKSRDALAPEATSSNSIPEMLEDFQHERQSLIAQIERDEINLDSEEAFPHSKFGLLTRRDWLYLVCFHSDRHIAQTQELLFVS